MKQSLPNAFGKDCFIPPYEVSTFEATPKVNSRFLHRKLIFLIQIFFVAKVWSNVSKSDHLCWCRTHTEKTALLADFSWPFSLVKEINRYMNMVIEISSWGGSMDSLGCQNVWHRWKEEVHAVILSHSSSKFNYGARRYPHRRRRAEHFFEWFT